MWETILSTSFLVDFVVSTFRMATPLTFAGLSCVISERCGVFNIGAEGMILAGAFAGAVGGLFTGSAWIGILLACLVGILMGLLLAILSIPLGANQIVSGIMINLLSLGLTSFLSRIIMGLSITQRLPSLEIWSVPYLADMPFLGKALFQQNPFSYISYGIVVFLYVVFYKTTWGLSIRAVGEHPRAAETAGINVDLIRYICVLLSGVFASLGGAFLSLGLVGYFVENMSAGRGFIGLTIVILGKWNPLGALFAALFFGAVDAFQLRIQAFDLGIPYQFLLMLPYICGLVAISGVVGRAQAPASVGMSYRREA